MPAGILPVATNTFSPVTVVTQEQIARDQPRTLGDALFDRPGISGTTYAPGAASRPIIRGLDNARVRIQENGIVNGGVSDLGEDHAVPVNPLVADRIEVIRGPATLRYGSGAIGGVVSADNNRVPTFIPANGVPGAGHQRVLQRRQRPAGRRHGGCRRRRRSRSTPTGSRPPTTATRSPAGSSAIPTPNRRAARSASRRSATAASSGISFSHYDAVYAIPGGVAEQDRTRLTPNQDRVLSRGEYRPLDGPFEVIRYWAGYSVYRHNEVGIGEDGIEGVQAIFKNREAEGRLELQHVPVFTAFGTLTGALGFQSDRRVINTQLESFLPKTESRANAVYLFEELELRPGTRLQAAGRYEVDRLSSTAAQFPGDYVPVDGQEPFQYARTRRFAPKSASIGALQDLPYGFVASLTGSYVERGPTGYELFSQGPHDATATFEIGNPDLKKERARTVEASIRRAEGPLPPRRHRLLHALYRIHLPQLHRPDLRRRFRLLRNRHRQPADRLPAAERHLLRRRDHRPVRPRAGGQRLRRHRGAVRLRPRPVRQRHQRAAHPALPARRRRLPAGRWLVRAGEPAPRLQPRRDRLFETPTPGYDDLRAELSYTKAVDPAVYGASAITLGVQGRNLLNDDIRNSTSFKKDEILLPGGPSGCS